MSRKQRKRKNSGGEDGAPGWMTTYGDLMSLLLAFFILIVSFSSIQESEFKKAMGSLQKALGLLRANVAVISPTIPDIYVPPRAKVQDVINKILRSMEQVPDIKQNISVEASDEGVRVRISNPLLFDVGKANIKQGIYPVLDQVATLLDTSNFQIVIEGHTDNIPIHNEQFGSNWELSAARSVAVVEYFVRLGLDPGRFTAVAYGEYRPLDTNKTEEGRAKNRRVEIFIPYNQKNIHKGPIKALYNGR